LGLDKAFGVHIIAVWERGRLHPVHPGTVLSKDSVAVIAGTADQMLELDTLLVIYNTNYNPVLVIGGGKVGHAAACALKERDIAVHLVERNEDVCGRLTGVAGQIFIGDAADRDVLMRAGLNEAPAVLLTTNDDNMNIYLSVYCRRLNPSLRIVSRITHQRNIEAIYRAGADFALSYASLGVEHVFRQLHSRELLIMGEGFELFSILLPPSLTGRTLGQSKIREMSGVDVIGIRQNGRLVTNPDASTILSKGNELVILGSTRAREAFVKAFWK
jgi:Trk K+ transport system NAD-binding subunit